MDTKSSKSWCKLYNITNETFLKIFKDKVSINNYKEKCEELNKEIILLKEQSASYTKANDSLENQVRELKESYERKVKDLPFYSNVCKRLKERLADSEQQYHERETYLKGIIRSQQKQYEALVAESDAVWPECQQLKQEKLELQKLELDLKLLQQGIEDERLKIAMKRDIHQKLFNSTIVDFVRRIRDQQENQKVIEEIGRYTRDGNLLLKEYEKALANAEKRKRNEEFSQYDKMLKFRKDDLPLIEKKQVLSPSVSTSSLLNLSSSKVSQNNTAFEKYKEREIERKKRLQELTKQSLLHSPSAYNKQPPEPKPQPQPKKTPIGKVQVLSQVFMSPGAHIKRKFETHPEARQGKMPRLNSGSQFGNQGDKKDINRGFGKPQEAEVKRVGFSTMQNAQFSVGADSTRVLPQFSDKGFKGGEADAQAQYVPFGGFPQESKQEQQKPSVGKISQEQKTDGGEQFCGKKISLENEESGFFSKPPSEQKRAPSPPKNMPDDDVFKMPKPYDSSFDFNASFNQVSSADNDAPNMIERSYEMPICFSPPYKNDTEAEPMFTEKNNSPKGGQFFLFQ